MTEEPEGERGMLVALLQCESRPLDLPRNLRRLASAAASASAAGAALLVCPEMFLTGYAIGPSGVQGLAMELSSDLASEPILAVAAIARESGVAIVCGFPELSGAEVYNAVVFVDGSGRVVSTYRKTHLFGELDRSQFTASRAPSVVFDWEGWKVALLVCYDVEFPETVRRASLDGADLVLVPTANMVEYDVVPDLLVPARAVENQVFVAYANYCGAEGSLTYGGRSLVAGPTGAVLASAGRGEELLFARLSRGALATSRAASPYLADRNPAAY
ncbi:carbon-nitrogen hydrolase family protein [Frondihabitans cladoniiphilus]|uniref:Carbon-nitrogen hydrolase family protein n=1 Tax=Frondihabitans cladoniiphilus TaxID=715785 RepID=A0ABP8VXP3_9MICO